MNELSTTDVVADEDVLVFSETQKVQPRPHLVSAPLVNCDTDRKWIGQKGSGSKTRKNFHQNQKTPNSGQKETRGMSTDGERVKLPGRDRVAHVSLFLLFLSFLNFGTRRNFALRLRFEKSVRVP